MSQLWCPKCDWKLEEGAAMKPVCPECGNTDMHLWKDAGFLVGATTQAATHLTDIFPNGVSLYQEYNGLWVVKER